MRTLWKWICVASKTLWEWMRSLKTLSEYVRTTPPAETFVLGLLLGFLLSFACFMMVNHEQRAELIEMYEAEIDAWEAVADRAYEQGRLGAERAARVARESGE